MAFDIENRFIKADKLVTAAQSRNLDPEIASYYCNLGCVMICGAIERSIETLITNKIVEKSAPQIKTFLKHFFNRGTNYKCDEISKLLYRFDSEWGGKFDKFVSENDQIRSSISSCYSVRNSIAHGGTQSIGSKSLKQYHDDAFTLIAELEKLLR